MVITVIGAFDWSCAINVDTQGFTHSTSILALESQCTAAELCLGVHQNRAERGTTHAAKHGQHNSRLCCADSERSSSQTNGIQEEAEDEEVVVPVHSKASVTAEQGLKHLLLTVDVERLYRSGSAELCILHSSFRVA